MASELTIVGGIYREECAYPRRSTVRGSAGRAALIAKSLGAKVTLRYRAPPELDEVVRAIMVPREIRCERAGACRGATFAYAHPLAIPNVILQGDSPNDGGILTDGESVLRFEMLESSAIVEANRAVYDPQGGASAGQFRRNGSRCNELAIVLNRVEAEALGRSADLLEAVRAIAMQELASVVVVKLGAVGAIVFNDEQCSLVNPWPTTHVWKIGSGDAFSAAFSVGWAVKQLNPIMAAQFASRAAAEYVSSEADFFHAAVASQIQNDAKSVGVDSCASASSRFGKKIYIAAPFFSTSQQWLVDEIRRVLIEFGADVFSPIHDVGEGAPNVVAEADLRGIENSDAVLAVLDGLDAGTTFEVGYAIAHKKPVIALAEQGLGIHSTMFEGSGIKIFEDLTSAIYNLIWLLRV